MESQPQNPEFRNNPENFHPCIKRETKVLISVLSLYDAHSDQHLYCSHDIT